VAFLKIFIVVVGTTVCLGRYFELPMGERFVVAGFGSNTVQKDSCFQFVLGKKTDS
jgi:hypothetical protein